MFDWRQLQRWGVPEDRLPAGSIVAHRRLNAWDRYRGYILAAVAICVLQGALIAGLLVERALRKRAERSAEARQRELTHVQRVAAMGELSGTLAHEIGQPLSAIRMNTRAAYELLLSPRPNRRALRRVLHEIDEDNTWAFGVIGRIRQVLRRKNSTLLATDINTLVVDAVALLRHELRMRSVTIRTTLAPTAPVVWGDRVELQQVIINLVLNACDASAALPEPRRQITIGTAVVDGSVEISVSDQGPGIGAVNTDLMFEPFVTTKEHGLGLGLAICRRIVVAHQGQIGWRNNADGGCTFWFRLPHQPTLPPVVRHATMQRPPVGV
jgi:C4-dicarboxylate-specific signal transduction histidine kinase